MKLPYLMEKKLTPVILTLLLTGCSITAPNLISGKAESGLSYDEMQAFDHDYRFSTKALTRSYIFRKLNSWLSAEPVNGAKLVKELLYGSYKYPEDLCSVLSDNSQFSDISSVSEVEERETASPAFKTFMDGCKEPVWTVTTFAGSGAPGHDDGFGADASFFEPDAITIGNDGNLYISEFNGNRVRKIITATREVITIAGNDNPDFGVNGSTDTSSSLWGPTSVLFDSSGNLYIADSGNSRIRKMTSDGELITVSNNVQGETNPSLISPYQISFDSSGILYMADFGGNRIMKMDSSGDITIVAGSGTTDFADGNGTEASFNRPPGVIVGPGNNLFVADSGNHRIRKINTSSGEVTTVAGSDTVGDNDGNGTNASFMFPTELAFDNAGNLYISDVVNNKIRKMDTAGNVTTIAGSGLSGSDNGPAASASFNGPGGIAVDNAGNIYVPDVYNNLIRKISR
jgi:sugar lactone lactonase YvrE